jgi:hypothetical protein
MSLPSTKIRYDRLKKEEKKRTAVIKQIHVKPSSFWKPMAVGVSQLPPQLVSAMKQSRGFKAKLIRSPERVMGLGDALRVQKQENLN